ncbi:hypothetical protein CALVIDRAFT_537592 [Calocera viscosa TUFC12733]|uniref:Uncharacterized protein n=1 Tax=Calocera viscosa (strain TUFC12733) TaxID=1330018 RepID=A0A167LTB0_CALVF|nr:hypothetical protein CALVIDRAFT_537592 [Calocera viscosa TUFC12733]
MEHAPTLSSATSASHQPPPEHDSSWWTFVTHPLPRNRLPPKSEEKEDATSPRSPAAPFEPHSRLTLPDPTSPISPTSPDTAGGKARAGRALASFFPRANIQRHLTMPSVPLPAPSSTPASPSTVLRSLQYPRPVVPLPRAPSPAASDQRPVSLHLDLSHPAELPSNTLRQVMTPGWESPWRPTIPFHPRAEEQEDYGWDLSGHVVSKPEGSGEGGGGGLGRGRSRARTVLTETGTGTGTEKTLNNGPAAERGAESVETRWKKGRKRWRNFCLYHSSTPLLFRLLNLIFTVCALGVAIHAQLEQREAGVEGVLGSSTAVTIVFAPLTLVHVFGAIYLEYFGRPLGLWRTSAKLAYTLVEVIFVCLWSSALSLAIDNYLTTPLRCAPRQLTSWWSDQPRAPNPLSDDDKDVGDDVCDLQAALICLVLVGLCSYCTNLVISLFRIFERVKVRTVDYRWGALGNAGV